MDRILIVKLGSIGDIVHTLPAAAALRKRFPHARIDWMVEARARAILEGCPVIDAQLVIDTMRWRRHWRASETPREIRRFLQRLRQTRYNLAIDFQGLFKSAVAARLSGAGQRIGFSRDHLREPGARFFYTHTVTPPSSAQHVIAKNNALLQPLGITVDDWVFPIAVTREDQSYIEDQLRSNGCDHFVIINPGGGWVNKLWPAERYGALARRLYEQWGLRSVITAGPGESGLVEAIRQGAPGKATVFFPTTIRQLAPLARKAKLFIGGDSGPLHIAAAAGTPILGIFGPTLPERNGPFRPSDVVVRRELPCLGCFKRLCPLGTTECMNIPVTDILASLADLTAGR